MDLVIRRLSPFMLGEYFDYFDNVAFSDHQEWAGCYCLHFHWERSWADESKLPEWNERRREYAVRYVRTGAIQGYFAYLGEEIVGWCNANDKNAYSALVQRKDMWDDSERGDKVKSIVCFNIAPHMRGKGIATKLLERVCKDAKADGYPYVEAYPHKGETDVYMNHYGPYSMYMQCGFELHKELERDCIVRKYFA